MLLSNTQLDAFKELLNIGIGKAATLLNRMVNSHVILQVPIIKVDFIENLGKELANLQGEKLSAVKLGFDGKFSGVTEIVFPAQSAQKLVAIVTGEGLESPNLDSFKAATLNEIANMILNSVMGVVANLLDTHFDYDIPAYSEDYIENLLKVKSDGDQIILFGETHFEIENLKIQGDIIILLELKAFEHLKIVLDNLLAGNE